MLTTLAAIALANLASSPHLASPLPTQGSSSTEFVIPDDVLFKAATKANELRGTSVNISTNNEDPASTVRVLKKVTPAIARTYGEELKNQLANTPIAPNGEEDPFTIAIIINTALIGEKIPECKTDMDALKAVLEMILAHEFGHCAEGDGGLDRPAQDSCGHLADLAADGTRICTKIGSVAGDETIPAAKRCRIVSALCKLLKEIQKITNTPDLIATAQDCQDVETPNGKIVQDCPGCPGTSCELHGHTFGNAVVTQSESQE
jgi:hypothetical protein